MILFILLNIVSFFRLVFILLIIYYLFKFFMRFMAPRLVDRAANKLFQDMKNREAEQTRRTTRSGDVIIDTNRKKQKHYSRNVGRLYRVLKKIKDKKK